jgi:O-antigen/teichoic acid export membrane protein
MPRFFSPGALRNVAHLGLLYFILQMALGVGMATDNVILSHFLGPEAVAQYSVPAKLFGLVSIGISMAMNPLWPAYGEASARGDVGWVRRTLMRSMALSLVGGLAGLALLTAAMPLILHLWVGGRISAPQDLMAALAVWTLIECWSSSVAVYLNGTGVVRLQVYVYAAFAFVCFGARVAFVGVLGLPGIPWGAVLAFGAAVLVPYTVFLRSRLRSGATGG